MPKASYKRRPDGRYAVVYKGVFFYSSQGGPVSEALQKRDEYKKQLALGLKEESLGMLFSTYAVRYMQVHKAECSTQTYNLYASYINKAIDFFGPDKRMQDITETDIKALYNDMVERGYGKYTLDKFSVLIKGVFRTAFNDGVIIRNPCLTAKKPKGLACGTHRTVTDEERRLIHDTAGTPMGLASMIMLYAGLRRGELMYVDADRDIDLEAKRISVRKAIHFDTNQPVVSKTKSKAGERSIPLFGPLPELLKDKHGLIVQKELGGIVSKTVFRNQWKAYMNYLSRRLNGVQKRWYGRTKEHKAILASGGELPPWKEVKFTPHDLRHSFVTMLYDAGVDIKTAVKWVGHADAKMIMQIYAHLSDQREKQAEIDAREHVEKLLK